MESFKEIHFLKLSDILCIFPFYTYADDGVKVLRQLSKASSHILQTHFNAIVNWMQKRTLIVENDFNEHLIRTLEKLDKYRLFKFEVKLLKKTEWDSFYKFIDTHDDIQFKQIYLIIEDDVWVSDFWKIYK